MSALQIDVAGARPLEIDFDRDPDASPARMNRFADYLLARIRAVEAGQPELATLLDVLKAVGLQRVQDGILPVMEAAMAVRDALQAIRDQWEGDLLPAEVLARAIAGVLEQVFTRGQVNEALQGYTPTGTAYTKFELDTVIATLASAASVYTKVQADARYLASANAARLVPADGAVIDSVLKWVGPGQNDFAWGGLAGHSWGDVVTMPTASGGLITFADIAQTYSDIMLSFDAVRLSANSQILISLYDGTAWSAPAILLYSPDPAKGVSGGCLFPRYRAATGYASAMVANNDPVVSPWVGANTNTSPQLVAWHCVGGIRGIRLSTPAVFTGGSVTLSVR